MDALRMETEEVELQSFLAEAEEEAEMENKRVNEGIFQVWWAAWLRARKEDDEEREDRSMFSVERPLAFVAVGKEWDESNEELFIELYDSVCGEKMEELLFNNWKKKKVEHEELEEDMELVTYSKKYKEFRNCWRKKYPQHGQFEDITKKRCMYYTCGPVRKVMFEGPRPRTLQVFSAKIGGCSNWPLQVYGLIAIRDFVDPQRIMVFNRYRDECQTVTEEDPYLTLTGPTRSVVFDMNESMGPVTIEAELKVKRAVESEDKYIVLDVISLPITLDGSRSFELAGPQMKLEISLGAIQKSVEATIFIQPADGTWPDGLHGQFVAKTAGMQCNEVMLLEFTGDGEMKQSRSVMSVEASGSLMVALKARGGEEVGCVIFHAFSKGVSSGTINIGSCSVQVHVGWSLISPYCEELVPQEFLEFCNF